MAKPGEYEAQQPLIPAPGRPVLYGAVDATAAATHNSSAGAASGSGHGDGSGSGSDTEFDTITGIRLIEVVAQSWSKWGLVVAYMRLATSTPRTHHQGSR